ncbi:hypothetical protein [Roseobacter sp. HKCCA2468]|uniref:hypothetical protein n=1 Tax=Roseobacter sp. HKCCA2468 TaxID=3120342 RepID=UPI0030ECC40A
MLRNTKWHPDQPLPKYADKATAAAIVTHLFFPISPRTLEKWPLVVRRPNKAAIFEVAELLRHAERKFEAAPPYKQSEV